MWCFYLNFLLYLFTFLYFFKKKKDIDIYNFLWLFYSAIALMSCITVWNGDYFRLFGLKNLDAVSFIPFLLCYIAFYLLFRPLKEIGNNVDLTIIHFKYEKTLIGIWLIIMLCYLGIRFSEASFSIASGLAEAYESRHIEGETLFDYSGNPLIKRILNFGVLSAACFNPYMLLICIDKIRKKEQLGLVILIVVLCFVPDFLSAIAQGSRGQIFNVFLKILFFVILFKSCIPYKIKKWIYISMSVFVGFMIFYSFMITIDRVSGSNAETPIGSIMRYFGECFPNLQFNFWDKVDYHPMGDRRFPDFTGFNKTFSSVDESYIYWQMMTHVPILNFKTVFGDMYIEFGTIGAFIFLFIYTFVVDKIIKKKATGYNISFVTLYFSICLTGFAGLTYTSGFSLFTVIMILAINFLIKRFYVKKRMLG